jgi:hypothetical protein
MKITKLQFLYCILPFFCLACWKESPRKLGAFDPSTLSLACASADYDFWETSDYVLPYPVGERYKINLSHCSGSYHSEGLPDQFAIDFAMNIGSIITASRGGVVVDVEESGSDFGFPNNKVVVMHNDETYAQYMHLTKNGAEVEIGDVLKQGDTIGLSGSTGLAGYPHLHFVATQKGSWKYPYSSFPTTFKNTKENELSLQSGETYLALPY